MNTTLTTNRIDALFAQKSSQVLTIYFTAGFPKLDDTKRILTELAQAGTDLIEIGMPFSDPIADGETIQYSNKIALDNGMSIKKLFEQLQNFRTEVPTTPVVLMGYINPVLQYGIEKFCQDCQKVGVDGLILPDLPFVEYEETYKPIFDKYGLYCIFLVTPQTSDERILKIDKLSKGFIYLVSSSSTTGSTQGDFSDKQQTYFERVNKLGLQNPTQIGFGISDKKSFEAATLHANGAIIGSAFIRFLETGEAISSFVQRIKD